MIARLTGTVQPYAWGSRTAIPQILGTEPTDEPQAELWLGAHPSAPSRLDGHGALDDLVGADPAGVLGAASEASFGPKLPYLLKILAAASPLSLQAHPSRRQAEEGFARENEAGVDDAHRSYKDDWPKPEALCALEPAEALCGFRAPAQTYALFAALGVDAATELVAPLQHGGADELETVFAALLRADRDEIAHVVDAVVAAARSLPPEPVEGPSLPPEPVEGRFLPPEPVEGRSLPPEPVEGRSLPPEPVEGRSLPPEPVEGLPLFARTAVELADAFPGDRGVLAALTMNRVGLAPYDALFLPAGNLHAYLHGTGIEIMANSDNVLRGGLTPKFVDVDELLAVLDFTPGVPDPVAVVEDPPGVFAYRTPAPEFGLWRIESTEISSVLPAPGTARIVLVVAGRAAVRGAGQELTLAQGQSAFVSATEGEVELVGNARVFVAAPGVEARSAA